LKTQNLIGFGVSVGFVNNFASELVEMIQCYTVLTDCRRAGSRQRRQISYATNHKHPQQIVDQSQASTTNSPVLDAKINTNPNTNRNPDPNLVTGARKYDHISPTWRELHWLPVRKWITFKLAVLVFKCLHHHTWRRTVQRRHPRLVDLICAQPSFVN